MSESSGSVSSIKSLLSILSICSCASTTKSDIRSTSPVRILSVPLFKQSFSVVSGVCSDIISSAKDFLETDLLISF